MINHNRSEFCYYVGLHDLDSHEPVECRESSIQDYIPLFEQNLVERKNWVKLNKNQIVAVNQIDFCFTNLAKLQTISTIHNRILLDTNHFISNKGYYYEKFKDEKFCPHFVNLVDANLNKFMNCPTILKPNNGSLSHGIKIFASINNTADIDKIYNHIKLFPKYKKWTISKLYISKKIDDHIITNRFYFLVRKIRKYDNVTIEGFLYDEFINYRSCAKYKNIDNITTHEEFLKIFVTNYDGNNTNFFKNRVIDCKTYLKLFTKEEYETIKKKITQYISIITQNIAKHATCSNDYTPNEFDSENTNMTYHLYGIDSVITDNLDIKFIEINGAPSLNNSGFNKLDYKFMINEIIKLTVDILFIPKKIPVYCDCNADKVWGKFKNSKVDEILANKEFISCGKFTKKLKTPVYFIREIVETYPFILDGFFNNERLKRFQRIKNPRSNSIHLFYGPRDLYVHDLSSSNYYDELAEWNKSENGRNAKVLNKIQGITYFLASKDKFHQTLYDCSFVPKSVTYILGQDETNLMEFVKTIRKQNPDEYFIIKPVHGSQGKGITIIHPGFPLEMFFKKMQASKQEFGYCNFAVSVYITNPKLYNKKKFNIRFYFLLHIKKLPTYSDDGSDVNIYILKDSQVYFTVLPYNVAIDNVQNEFTKLIDNDNNENNNENKIANKISKLTIADIQRASHITNFQIAKDLSEKLNMHLPLNKFTCTLEDLNYDATLYDSVKSQARAIIIKSIDSVKFDVRPLNRFVTNSSAFNLLACDTMLDQNNVLHLIEINRGPDLHGLYLTIGNNKITSIFTELFDIVIDNKYDNFMHYDKYEVVY